MAPLRRHHSHYVFHYSVPQATAAVTFLHYRSLSAPYRVRSARPTITRTFKQALSTSARRAKKALKRDATPVPQHERTPSPTPPPSPVLPSTPTHHLGVSTRAKTPDSDAPGRGTASTPRKTASTPRKDKGAIRSGALTRSSSRVSVKDEGPMNASKSRSRKRPGPPSPDASIWTRFGIKNGAPIFLRRERTSSSTDRECVTTYYESFSLEELRVPPDLADDPQLEEGDIYINTVYGTGGAQMWIWTRDGGKVAFWKVAKEGDIREDGRRLSITPTLGLPSWVKPEWCMRQLLKQQRDK